MTLNLQNMKKRDRKVAEAILNLKYEENKNFIKKIITKIKNKWKKY